MSRILGLAILMLLSLGAPAAAQFVGKPVYEPMPAPNRFVGEIGPRRASTGRELGRIRDQIDRARGSGELTAREARQLHREARLIDRAAQLYGRGGLSPSESRELQVRTQILRDELNRPTVAEHKQRR
jgi:hypothetical protein